MSPTKRQRVLIVGHSLSGGGAERFTSTLLAHLDRHRFEPVLATLTEEVTYPLPRDVSHFKLGYRGMWSFFSAVSCLQQTIEVVEPDVILSTFDLPTLFVGCAKVRKSDSKSRWIARLGLAVDRPSFSLLDSFSRQILNRIYRNIDHFVANSQGLADGFVRKYPFVAGKIDTIYNAVDSDQLQLLAAEEPLLRRDINRPLIIAAGRLHPQKRFDLLLDAYAQLRRQFNPQLWILGAGPLQTSLEKRITQNDWQQNVKLLGYLANPFPLISQGDLFVLTSDYEGMPHALLEAQALGLPAIATNADFGPAEIVQEGVTGHLVPRGDVSAIVQACTSLLENENQRQTMSHAACQSTATRFAIASLISQWETLLHMG